MNYAENIVYLTSDYVIRDKFVRLIFGILTLFIRGVSMKKTTSTLLSMALVFSSFGALSAHAESLQKRSNLVHS